MTKSIAEQSNALSIFWLKKQGYFPRGGCMRSGTVSWSYGMSENKSSISIFINVRKNEENYINLNYTHTDHWTEEKSKMDYKIQLATTPCNFGGVRHWFVCPLYKGGRYCGGRVGVIYNIGKWFGCRHCGEIAYQAQLEGGRFRVGSVCEPDVEKAYNEVKTMYYKGKPTRRYKRYLRLREKMNDSWKRMAIRFGTKF